MVDDHDVGLGGALRASASRSSGELRAVPSKTLLARGRTDRTRAAGHPAGRRFLRDRPFRCRRPIRQSARATPRSAGRETRRGLPEPLQAMQTEVVGPALHVCRANVAAERAAERWKILMEDLVLKRTSARRDEHAAAGEDRRDEIRERLARSGARFGDERAAAVEACARPRRPACVVRDAVRS